MCFFFPFRVHRQLYCGICGDVSVESSLAARREGEEGGGEIAGRAAVALDSWAPGTPDPVKAVEQQIPVLTSVGRERSVMPAQGRVVRLSIGTVDGSEKA